MRQTVASLTAVGPARLSALLLLGTVAGTSLAHAGGPADARPEVVYATVVDAGFVDEGDEVVVDSAGNAYVLGFVTEQEYDAIILKLDPSGEVLFSVTLGGNALVAATDLLLDESAGAVYVTGYTTASDFPVVRAFQPELNGPSDAFIVKLDAADGSFEYSTYLGGTRSEQGYGLAVDAAGNLVVAGATDSTNFPTVDPFQAELSLVDCFCDDAFVVRFSPDGQTLLYGTYLGGQRTDGAREVGLDADGRIYVVGETDSPDFPLAAPLQDALAGDDDGFAAALTADGSALVYSSYLGGSEGDAIRALAVDDAGHATVVGYTESPDYPTTADAFQPSFVGGIDDCGSPPFEPLHNCTDVTVTKLLPDGSGFAYSTYVGGHDDDRGHGVAVGPDGSAVVVGYTASGDFPGGPSGVRGVVFLSQLSSDGSTLRTGRLDSRTATAGDDVALGDDGDLYLAGARNVPADIFVVRVSFR